MKKHSLTLIIALSLGYGMPVEIAAQSYTSPVYQELPLGAIKPKGWLAGQLKRMRVGSTGHLDETYEKLQHDNGWLGGKGDGWEETPYWLDGAVPLAYLLDDHALQQKVLRYINWILENQRPSGYFGPLTAQERKTGKPIAVQTSDQGEDWWPKMVVLKVLKQYYTATQDKRVIPFMTKYFNYQLAVLKESPIGKWTEWSESRGSENILIIQWLYSLHPDERLLELAQLIESQSYPWSTWLGNRDWVIQAAAQQNGEHWMHRHAVNVAMGLKSPALNYQRTGNAAYLEDLRTGFHDLMTLHGLPMGIFSGDEDLHGNDPTQGVELCAIVESMFSLEQVIGITGDIQYMDALERMTFNALPTQTTDDYNEKQYFQIANQVQVKRGVFNFSLPFDREMNNVFGARSGYTCCLTNMHQGWTKFATHLWYKTAEGGLAALTYSPNEVTTTVGAKQVKATIKETTNYPFDEQIGFELGLSANVDFPFLLRIPSWCQEATIQINGKVWGKEKGGQVVSINRTWKDKDQVTLELPMQVSTSNWGRNSRTIERGPLIYALRLEEQWQKGHDAVEGDYWEVYPKGKWNYGLLDSVVKQPENVLKVKKVKPVTADFVWNLTHAPIEITAPVKEIPGWGLMNDVAPQPVTDRGGLFKGKTADQIETVRLVPYGCTKVRVVAFPVVK